MKRKEGDFHANEEESLEEESRPEKEEVRRQEEEGLMPHTLFDLRSLVKGGNIPTHVGMFSLKQAILLRFFDV